MRVSTLILSAAAVVLLVGLPLALNENEADPGSASRTAYSSHKPEAEEPSLSQKLAAVESKFLSGVYDATLSSSMERRLERLAGKCPETELQIADVTVRAQQLLERGGVSKSLRQIMDDIDYMIPSGELGVTYAESAALYVTMQSQ
ncbi:MAG: hypothetical protein ACYTG0_37360 [Planctomycetota bacterium]|jgi:hypothetical protein